MTPKLRAIVERAISEGTAAGLRRAHKHTDTPGQDYIRTEVESCIMDALDEVVTWDEDEAFQ